MASILLRYGGRRREWNLLLLIAVSWIKARGRIREILDRCALVTLRHRLLVKKGLRRWSYAFLSICHTAPARLSAIRALKQASREHASASWLRLGTTAKPNGSKDLPDTF